MHDQNIKGEKRMVIQEKKRNGRVSSFVLDTLHVIVGILIVILAVLAFLNPDENRILFPAIFLLAALLNFANGYDRFHNNRGKKKKRLRISKRLNPLQMQRLLIFWIILIPINQSEKLHWNWSSL